LLQAYWWSLCRKFFFYLLKNGHINYINQSTFINSHHKIPLLITSSGIEFFKFFGNKLNTHDFAYACLDGTEKKPHLGGKIGEIILEYFFNNKLLYKNNKNRCLYLTKSAKEILMGNFNAR
jgi:hypothetical protein